MEYVGTLHTVMSRALAATRSMLLKPVPASQMSRTEAGREATSTGTSFVMSTLWPSARDAMAAGLGVGSSWRVGSPPHAAARREKSSEPS